jgi:hypothetical protein
MHAISSIARTARIACIACTAGHVQILRTLTFHGLPLVCHLQHRLHSIHILAKKPPHRYYLNTAADFARAIKGRWKPHGILETNTHR